MPITTSKIIEDSIQADGRRWITEQHTNSVDEILKVTYLADADLDVMVRMNNRIPNINQQLIDQEINQYLNRIEKGEKVIGLDYPETTREERTINFLEWGKQMIKEENFQALKHVHLVVDPYSEAQINGLLEGTKYENKADKIKSWVLKIDDMNIATDNIVIAAEEAV